MENSFKGESGKEKINVKVKRITCQLGLMNAFLVSDLYNKEQAKKIVKDIQLHNSRFPVHTYLEDLLQKEISSIIGEVEVKDFAEKYDRIFLMAREPNAFFTYCFQLKNYDNLRSHLQVLYRAILEGNFQEVRYATKPGDHLSTVFGSKESLRKLWIEQANMSVSITNESAMQQRFHVEDSDSWEDLLLCGTEVLGSCQKINGNTELNRCLLNYIIDGKVRAVVLKDAKGRIHARVILRLLWDEELKRPVLFREKLYKNPGVFNQDIQLIEEMCLFKAKTMGIPLVQSKSSDFINSDYRHYLNNLKSLNGRTLSEYVDAVSVAHGKTNGCFTISSSSTMLIYEGKNETEEEEYTWV